MSDVVDRAPGMSFRKDLGHSPADLLPWIVPALGLALVGLGAAMLVDLPPRLAVYTPVVLVAIGMTVLLVYLALPRPTVPVSEPTVSRSTVPEREGASTFGQPPISADRSVARRRELNGVGSEWRVLSSPSVPGDETWLSWLPRERRRLGPDPASSAPGVVHSTGRAGNLVAFPVRNYFAAGPPREESRPSLAGPSSRGSDDSVGDPSPETTLGSPSSRNRASWLTGSTPPHPYSVEELDRMFPPLAGGHRVFLEDAPQRIGARSVDPTMVRPRPDRVSSESPPTSPTLPIPTHDEKGGPSPENALSIEATNPVPPHLRPVAPLEHTGAAPPARAHSSLSSARSVCASCSTVVVNLRMSGPCPNCLRPICDDCLREALRSHARGWCADCLASLAPAS